MNEDQNYIPKFCHKKSLSVVLGSGVWMGLTFESLGHKFGCVELAFLNSLQLGAALWLHVLSLRTQKPFKWTHIQTMNECIHSPSVDTCSTVNECIL